MSKKSSFNMDRTSLEKEQLKIKAEIRLVKNFSDIIDSGVLENAYMAYLQCLRTNSRFLPFILQLVTRESQRLFSIDDKECQKWTVQALHLSQMTNRSDTALSAINQLIRLSIKRGDWTQANEYVSQLVSSNQPTMENQWKLEIALKQRFPRVLDKFREFFDAAEANADSLKV